MVNLEDIAKLLPVLSVQDRQRHEEMLQLCLKKCSITEAARSAGKSFGEWHMITGRLRAKYLGPLPKPKRPNPLNKLALTTKEAWKEIREIAKSNKSPTVKLRALTTILEHQAKIAPEVVAPYQTPIIINLVATAEEFEQIKTGGKFASSTKQDS